MRKLARNDTKLKGKNITGKSQNRVLQSYFYYDI